MTKRKSNTAGTLFAGDNRLLFATNRANVLSILSSGLIRARAAYSKYYDDLLAVCPGHILLFRRCFPRSLMSLLSGSEAGLFPVLVEIDTKRLSIAGKSVRVKMDLTLDLEVTGHVEDVFCELVSSPIPSSAIARLCFDSQENLEDFKARDFNNVPALFPLAVVPSFFGEGGPDPDHFRSILQQITPAPGSVDDFRHLDSAMGAMNMLSLLVPPMKTWLNGLAASTAFPNTIKTTDSGAPKWLTSLVGRIMARESLTTEGLGTDDLLMAAAVNVLRSMSPLDGWVESKVASDIASEAMNGADSNQSAEIESWRDVVIAVAKADRQAGSLSDAGSVVRRGLMLLVLRCQPERIVLAGDTPLKPGPMVTAIAGLMSGLFHGYSRLSKDLKIQGCPAGLLSRLAVSWWSSVDRKARKITISTSVCCEDATTAKVTVSVDHTTFVERIIRPNDAMMRLYYHAKGLGYSFDFDPELNAFIHQTEGQDGMKRKIVIEAGSQTPRGQATIRIRTLCHDRKGNPIRLMKREDALKLLERNHDPQIQCRFAVEPGTGNVEVLVHQLLETLDSPELQSHFEAVINAASEIEAIWRSPPPAKRQSACALVK